MCVSEHVLKFDCRGIGSNSGFSLVLVLQLSEVKGSNSGFGLDFSLAAFKKTKL